MRILTLLTILILSYAQLTAQGFEGIWSGSFYSNTQGFIGQNPIQLSFKWNQDSTYDVKSYSKCKTILDKDTIAVCQVKLWVESFDTIILVETGILEPLNPQPTCLQKMKLKIIKRKNKTVLAGTWHNDNCPAAGTVRFVKQS